MKICYVANSRFPSERAHMTQIVQMCNAFVENGHEVTLAVTNRKTNISEDPESFFGTHFLFKVIRISVPDVAGVSPHIPPFFRPSTFLIQRFLFAYRSAKYIKKHQFDLVYGRDEWILWLLTFLIKIPILWESHEAKFSRVAHSLLEKTKRIVVISEGIRDFYIQHGVSEKTILVAHDAVDERFFESHTSKEKVRETLGIKTNKPVVMYIGGLETWKGAETLCRVAEIQSQFKVFIIGGKEKEINILKKKYPNVRFLGPHPYKELPLFQQAADILVIPNTATVALSAEYTSPLKLFTYMTSKKPIVASRIPSITNILSEDDAFFFTPDDSDSLLSTIASVLEAGGSAESKALCAYRKSFFYTWHNRAKEIFKFFINK